MRHHPLETNVNPSIRSSSLGLFILYQLKNRWWPCLSQAFSAFIPPQSAGLVRSPPSFDGLLSGKGWSLGCAVDETSFRAILLAILALFLPRIAQSGLVMNSGTDIYFGRALDGKTVWSYCRAGLLACFPRFLTGYCPTFNMLKLGAKRLVKVMATGLLSFGIASLLYLIGRLFCQENFIPHRPIRSHCPVECLSPWFGSFIMQVSDTK